MKKDKSNKLSKRTVSGQPADEIVLNPNDKAEKKLSEAITDTAVITFGRMNPPTVGHLSLVEKMLDIALENKAYPLIYLSHTYDPKKNPLSYDEKFDLVREAFGDYVAGPSHVLPTSGNARFDSGLSVLDFFKRTSYLEASKNSLLKVASDINNLANIEGLTAHALSAKIRYTKE